MHLTHWTLVTLIAVAAPAFAQAPTQDPSGQWQPDVELNELLLREAERALPAAPSDRGARSQRGGGPGGRSGGAGRPPPGGNGGRPKGPPPGSNAGGARSEGGRPSLENFLPAQGAFAAPKETALVMQRMREAVLFGTADGDEVLVMPLSGTLDFADGTRATLREADGRLTLHLDLTDGRRVTYRYTLPDSATDDLQIEITVEGDRLPGGGAQLQRLYRRMNVGVGATEKVS